MNMMTTDFVLLCHEMNTILSCLKKIKMLSHYLCIEYLTMIMFLINIQELFFHKNQTQLFA